MASAANRRKVDVLPSSGRASRRHARVAGASDDERPALVEAQALTLSDDWALSAQAKSVELWQVESAPGLRGALSPAPERVQRCVRSEVDSAARKRRWCEDALVEVCAGVRLECVGCGEHREHSARRARVDPTVGDDRRRVARAACACALLPDQLTGLGVEASREAAILEHEEALAEHDRGWALGDAGRVRPRRSRPVVRRSPWAR